MTEFYTLDRDSIGTLRDVVQWWRNQPRGEGPNPAEPFTKFGPHLIRIARTCVTDDYPTYPDPPANTFGIEWGHVDFAEVPGCQTATFTAYSPQVTRIAHDLMDAYWPEGTLVYVMLLRGKWFIIGALTPEIAEGELTYDLCWSDATATVDTANMLTGACREFSPANVVNPRRHQGRAGYNVLMVRKKCQGECASETSEWQIMDIRKRGICMVNGLQGDPVAGDGCLKYGSVVIAAEWCPDGEPDPVSGACKVVDYTRCTGSGSGLTCDLAWEIRVPTGTDQSGSGEQSGCC